MLLGAVFGALVGGGIDFWGSIIIDEFMDPGQGAGG